METLLLHLQPSNSHGHNPRSWPQCNCSQDFLPLMKALRRSHEPLRGCVTHSATKSAKAVPPHGPAAANCFCQTLNSVLEELNTAVSFRSLPVAMGYMNSKLRMEPKQALKYQPSSGKLKEVLQHLQRNQASHDEGQIPDTITVAEASWMAAAESCNLLTAAKNILSMRCLQIHGKYPEK